MMPTVAAGLPILYMPVCRHGRYFVDEFLPAMLGAEVERTAIVLGGGGGVVWINFHSTDRVRYCCFHAVSACGGPLEVQATVRREDHGCRSFAM